MAVPLLGLSLQAQVYYVAVGGSNNLSTNINAPGNIAFAFANAPSGSTVYVKAGNYGAVNLVVGNPNTTFIGYKSAIGDLSESNLPDSLNTFLKQVNAFENNYPVINKNRASGGSGIQCYKSRVTLKNFFVKNFQIGFDLAGRNIKVENFIVQSIGNINSSYNGVGLVLFGDSSQVKNGFVLNAAAEGVSIKGSYNQVKNVKVFANENENFAPTNYYFILVSNSSTGLCQYNLLEDCYAERVGNLSHPGHGICVVGDYIHRVCSTASNGTPYYCFNRNLVNRTIQHNKIRNCKTKNIFEMILLRGTYTRENEFINVESEGGVIHVTMGSRNNKFINCKVHNAPSGIQYSASTYGEVTDSLVLHDGQGSYPWDTLYTSKDNQFINCLFSNVDHGICLSSYFEFEHPTTLVPIKNRLTRKIIQGEKIINCTFIANAQAASGSFFQAMRGNRDNLILNSIIYGFKHFETRYSPQTMTESHIARHSLIPTNFTFEHCNFFNNGSWQAKVPENGSYAPIPHAHTITAGINDQVGGVFIHCNALDPCFVDPAKSDYDILGHAGCGAYQRGRSLQEMVDLGYGFIDFDIANRKRPCKEIYDIGAYEFQDCFVGLSDEGRDASDKLAKLYPNPSSGNFVVKLSGVDNLQFVYISIYDRFGREVTRQKLTSATSEINCPSVASGMYFYQLMHGSAKLSSGKLCIQRD